MIEEDLLTGKISFLAKPLARRVFEEGLEMFPRPRRGGGLEGAARDSFRLFAGQVARITQFYRLGLQPGRFLKIKRKHTHLRDALRHDDGSVSP